MKFWHIYVWIFSAVLLVSAIGRLVLRYKKPDLVSRLDVVESGVGLLCIPALFGFAYQHAYASRLVWELLCLAIVGFSIYQFFTPKMRKLYQKGVLATVSTITLQFVIGAPALWALLRYAFSDRQLWS